MINGAKAIVVVLIVAIIVAFVCGYMASKDEDWARDAMAADSALSVRKPDGVSSWRVFRTDSASASRRVFAPKRIEINGADSLALCSVYGIGKVFSSRIMARREELGGFCRLTQLMEVRGITAEVYDRIVKNFWIDSAGIRKISANFAPHNDLASHPYCTPSMARRIERGRMKGGFSNTQDLIERDILLPKEAQRLAPYLSFEQ